jgi:predicted Ser/Thr protein kinase
MLMAEEPTRSSVPPAGESQGEAPTLPPAAATETTASAAPVNIPGYEVLGELGRGGMGVVYKARQIGLNRLVALKMILAGEHAGPQEKARFRLEAEAVARLQHPGIVQIYDIGEQEGRPYFSLEFVDGGSLAQQLDGTPLPVWEAARLTKALARAVHHAHQRGIVHRDLKPANVLLTAEGTPKITDFGLAKLLGTEGQTQSGAVVGTPSYMAPEQAGGKKKLIGPATDVYALGAILYELLTGRPPFRADTPLDTLLQVMSEEPVPPSRLHDGVPRRLETICLKCLRKDPAQRYANAEALAEDLRRFLAGEPIQARPMTRWEKTVRLVKRQRSAVLVLGGALATGLLVMLVWLLSRPGEGVVGSGGQSQVGTTQPKSDDIERVQRLKELAPDPERLRVLASDGVERVQRAAERAQSANNLKQLALAMHNYRDAKGRFPSPAAYDKDDKPLLSWRVLVLPYLEADPLFRQFRLDEAWDSEHNKKLLEKMPKVFAPVRGQTKEPYSTFFQVFVGPGAAFEGKQGLRLADFTDGTANTFLIVEGGEAVPWTKPVDLPYDPKQPLPKLGGLFPDGFYAAFADGGVRFIRKENEKTLRAYITRNGGEQVPPPW